MGLPNAASSRRYIAFDLGAESARAIVGTFEKDSVALEELHRWPSRSVEMRGTRYWDVLFMFAEVKKALRKYCHKYGSDLEGMAVDSWGVDFGILGETGQLLQNPVHYRDHRTDGILEKALEVMSREALYQETGIQLMQINTLFQLWSLKTNAPEVLREGRTFLMMSDLFHYFLSGVPCGEYTNASTTQLLDVRSRQWSDAVMAAFDLPRHLMPEIVEPGTILGPLDSAIAEDVGLGSADVIAPCTHDTASAVLAVPADGDDWAYISCGTWSLMGMELPEPITSEGARVGDFTNEGGICPTILFLKNIPGLWLLQQARAMWAKFGEAHDYAELTDMARSAPPFVTVINIDDPVFLNPVDMLDAIAMHCKTTGQQPPHGAGATVRAILEGIALSYAVTLSELEQIVGRRIKRIHMVGGGIKNELLCQLASDATGRPVIAGPVEATAMGNVVMQAIATGLVADRTAARRLIARTVSPNVFEPRNTKSWRPLIDRLCSPRRTSGCRRAGSADASAANGG
jgi:rhamnulokinase